MTRAVRMVRGLHRGGTGYGEADTWLSGTGMCCTRGDPQGLGGRVETKQQQQQKPPHIIFLFNQF